MGVALDKPRNDEEGVGILLEDIQDGGIMRWSKKALKIAGKLLLGDSLVEKKLHMISYIFEIIDDLMIEPRPEYVPERMHGGVHDGEGADTRQPMSSPFNLSHDCIKKMFCDIQNQHIQH